MSNNELFNRYPYIYAWHKLTGSFDYYIISLIDQAIKDDAPKNSIYKRYGAWCTVDDLSINHPFKQQMNDLLQMKGINNVSTSNSI